MPLFDPVLRGFGDLGSAVLLAPQLARRNRLEEEDRLLRQQQNQAALDQAFQIHQENQQARADEREANKMFREDELKLRKQELDSRDADRKTDNTRLMMEDIGTGVKNVAKFVSGVSGAGKASKPPVDHWQLTKNAEGEDILFNPRTQEIKPAKPPAMIPTDFAAARNDPNIATQALQTVAIGEGTPNASFLSHPISRTSQAIGNLFYNKAEPAAAFNASNFDAQGNPLMSDKLKQAIAISTKGQPRAAVQWQPPAEYADQYQRILATGDAAKIAEAERRLGKPQAGR